MWRTAAAIRAPATTPRRTAKYAPRETARGSARRFQFGGCVAHRTLVERFEHGAGVVDAAADLARQALRCDRRRLLKEIIEYVAVARLALRFLHGAKAA